LKSIPVETSRGSRARQRAIEIEVETSARKRQRIARDAAQHLAQVDVAVRLDRGHGQRRQRAAGGIADDAQRRERQARLGGIGRRDMAFHVDRRAPVSECSAALQAVAAITCSTPARPPRTTRRRPSAMLAISSSFSARPASQRVSPAMTSVATTTSPDFSDGSSPPATPKLMTPLNVDGIQRRQQRAQLLRIATAADHDHAGPGRDAGLLHKTSHDQNRPWINRIETRIAHGSRRPPPPNHPAVGASQISIPRQRPERKELRVAMIAQIKHPRKARCRVALLVPQPFFGLCGF
jgi:hypothetical protein